MGDIAVERSVEQRAAVLLSAEETLPCSDGLPMAETELRYRAIMSMRLPLELLFENSADRWVAGDIFLYYDETDVKKFLAPDVMVAFGVENRRRKSYVVWEEGKPPDLVVEVTSPSSRKDDLEDKRSKYAIMGALEYLVFDPMTEDARHDGRLRLFRLIGGHSVEIEPSRWEGGAAVLESQVLGMSIRAEGKCMRLRDLRTGKDLLNIHEERHARQLAERQRDAAEDRIAELEARLRSLDAPPDDNAM